MPTKEAAAVGKDACCNHLTLQALPTFISVVINPIDVKVTYVTATFSGDVQNSRPSSLPKLFDTSINDGEVFSIPSDDSDFADIEDCKME